MHGVSRVGRYLDQTLLERASHLGEMGLVQVAKAIAEGKVKVTVSDLDKIIRLEEFLREEGKAGEQTKVVIEWIEHEKPGDTRAAEKDGIDNDVD